MQGPCKACTQAGCDATSPPCKGPLFPSELLTQQAGRGREQPEEQKSQVSSIPVGMAQQPLVLQLPPMLCLW